MTKSQATAEVFWTAFQGLSPQAQQDVLRRVLENRRLRRDLLDLAIIESRRNESGRSLRAYMNQDRNKGSRRSHPR